MRLQNLKPGVFYKEKFDETKRENTCYIGETRFIYLFEKLKWDGVSFAARGLFIGFIYDKYRGVFIMNKNDYKYHLYSENEPFITSMNEKDFNLIKKNMRKIVKNI